MIRSRLFDSFHIAGFQRYDGASVLSQLEVGTPLSLVPDFSNPYDPEAVALMFGNVMLGYVPCERNAQLAQFLYFGHGNAFECKVTQVDPQQDPWRQVRVGVYVVDRSQH